MTVPNPETADSLYTRRFFQVFAAVLLFMTGVALQYHFGQYVEYLGHGVDTLGRILSMAMVGTLLIRLQVGRWIDRFGCRRTWLAGTLVVTVAVGLLQFATRLWAIVLLRTGWAMGMAAVMTTVPVFAARIAPPHRRAEFIGSIGLAGFCGMVIGPTLGDWIFSHTTTSIVPYRVFFSASAVCGLLAGAVMLFITLPEKEFADGKPAPAPAVLPAGGFSQIRVIVRHWPGTVLLVGVVFSMVFCLQSMYLERLAEARGFKDIKVFFLVYAPTAMTLRLLGRRVPERLGRSRALCGGLLLLAVGLFFLRGVQSQGELVLPALLMGAGHCFVFPSMVDLAAERLPPAHRGTGTALVLGAGDLGMLTGFVVLGELIDRFGFDAALTAFAATVVVGTVLFAISSREAIFSRRARTSRRTAL